MLHIHFSHRLETLRSLLLQRLCDSRPGVFEAEQLIVPHAAMRRWLSLAIADAQGICANVQFHFLAQWLWRQIGRLVPGVADDSPYAAQQLAWRVHGIFGNAAFVARHPRLAAYLADADELMRYELAGHVATVLEHYVTYRAEWLRAWRGGRQVDLGPDEAWQAALWQRIDGELGMHALHPARAFVDALQAGGTALAREVGLPASAHVFALPGMPPLHLQLLQQLAPWVELHLYVLNPCREYWFELVDRRRLSHLAVQGRDAGHEEGNRLLASWGKATQAQVEALVELCDESAEDDGLFELAPGRSLLRRVQNAVLELQPIEPGSMPLADGDRSIEMHVCHSLTRELEVLQDHLLGLFAADSSLSPADILVVTPDLDRAAPLIDTVFGTAPKERALPYAIAGRSRSGQNRPARALLALLALASSRCTASDVFAALQQPIVARRFALDDDALVQVHAWLREAGFHWAMDAEHRAGFGLPATPRHTLDDALQRLFLGHALPAAASEPFADLLGAGDAEGSRALALGAFWRFATGLQRLQRELQRPQRPEAWAAALFAAIDDFSEAAGDELDELSELQDTIRRLAEDMRGGGVDAALPLDVVRAALQKQLDDPARSGAAGGSVSFASMSSHRGLPYAVVCIIGLNDGAFPSTTPPAEFDLIALHPRRGDRQRRLDERGLMLDLLLAARQSLYLSHTGRSVRDNAPLPPSVLLAELLDLLLPAVATDPQSATALQAAHARLVVEHPLQPFARECFGVDGDARLRSHDSELADALRTTLAQQRAAPAATIDGESDDEADDADDTADESTVWMPQGPFFAAPLPPPEAAWRRVSLSQLTEFFRNPARYLLRRRLGIELPRDAEALVDEEPFVSDGLAQSALARRLLPAVLQGTDPDRLYALARAGIEWPDGHIGARQLRHELAALQQFGARVSAATAEACLPPQAHTIDLDLDGEAWSLQAAFADLRPSGLLRWRYGDSRAGDYLEAWLSHLALCAAASPAAATRTRWLSADGEFAFDATDDARQQLGALLRLYRQGLRAALHFYPRAAWKFVLHGRSQALAAWHASADRPFGEERDPAYKLALRGLNEPLDEAFETLATTVFGPLREQLVDARVKR